jgi:hypothetical protein
MSDDPKQPADSTPEDQPAPKKDATMANVKRKTLSTDPTMPIKLDRSMWKKPAGQHTPASTAPTEAVPTLKDTPAAKPDAGKPAPTADAKGDEWMGKEQTLVGLPKPGATKIKIASMDEDEGWLGTEQTMVGGTAAGGAAAKADEKEAGEWLGSEATSVGMPVPKM